MRILGSCSIPTARLRFSPMSALLPRTEGHVQEEEPWRRAREAGGCASVRAAEWGRSSCCQPITSSLRIGRKLWRTKRYLELLSCLSTSKCPRKPGSCCSPTKEKKMVPSLPFISMGKGSTVCSLPAAARGGKHAAPFAWVFLILVLHQLAANDGQVSLVPGAGSSPASAGRAACCCQSVGRRALLQVRAAS